MTKKTNHNWQTKKLSEVSKINYGYTEKASFKEIGPKFLRITDIQDNCVDWETVPFCKIGKDELSKYLLSKGDIVFARTGATTGKSFLLTNPPLAVFASYLIKLRILDLEILAPEFLFLFFQTKTYWDKIETGLSGSAQGGFNATKLAEISIPLPPLPEQQRIVAILDEAFAAIATAKENAEKNLQNAHELFQSVLSQAVIGELTKEWREEQGEEKTKSDTDLKEIHLRIKGREKKTSRSEETTGHGTITKALPKEWQFTSIESLFNLIDYRGKNPPRTKNGRRLITAKNIKMGYLSDEPITFVSEETYRKWMVRGFPKPDDIFFVTEGHTMGFVALNTRNDDFALAQRTITLQPIVSFSTKYFFYFMMSFYFQSLVKLNATGAAAVGMKASKFRSLPLPFPSFVEQQRIVAKLDALSDEAKKLEAIYRQKLADLDELKKSVLEKAFSGDI